MALTLPKERLEYAAGGLKRGRGIARLKAGRRRINIVERLECNEEMTMLGNDAEHKKKQKQQNKETTQINHGSSWHGKCGGVRGVWGRETVKGSVGLCD
jgi:hypothetical protein